MRTERLLRADGIIYGNVRGYYEDKHTYTFVINRKDIVFPKARYKLNKKDRYYIMAQLSRQKSEIFIMN